MTMFRMLCRPVLCCCSNHLFQHCSVIAYYQEEAANIKNKMECRQRCMIPFVKMATAEQQAPS